MKTKKLRAAVLALAVTATTILFAGCGASTGSDTSQAATPTAENISGSITAAGSTALQPLADAASKKFTDKNPDATITVQGGGSGTGLSQIASGSIDIGDSDLAAEEKLSADQAKALVDHKVCVVAFGTIINSKVTGVDNLTKKQLQDIFTGKIKNWKDVGGNDLEIHVVNRPASSGTRATFKKYALDGMDEVQGVGLTEDSSGAVLKTVQTTDGSISYLASSYLWVSSNDVTGIKVLKLDGVEMKSDTVSSGKYPIWSYEHMYTKGEASGLTKAFIDYLMNDKDAKTIMKDKGYIAIADMKTSR
ncbi:MAG: phosphate ABC transporter substrate-binding protein [Bacillota bacterium]|nr:phosphate ABC transporter substrate-binding protein [Bacillota bacterium]